jgi:hypothetical protein
VISISARCFVVVSQSFAGASFVVKTSSIFGKLLQRIRFAFKERFEDDDDDDLFHTPHLVHASTVDRGRTRLNNHGEEGRDARTTRRAQGKRYVASHRRASLKHQPPGFVCFMVFMIDVYVASCRVVSCVRSFVSFVVSIE